MAKDSCFECKHAKIIGTISDTELRCKIRDFLPKELICDKYNKQNFFIRLFR